MKVEEVVEVVEGVKVVEVVEEVVEVVGGVRHRAALYALGHIVARELGFKHVVESVDSELVSKLIQLAEECPTLSLRGSYVGVLGMLARCSGGTRALFVNGWSIPGPCGGSSTSGSEKTFTSKNDTAVHGSGGGHGDDNNGDDNDDYDDDDEVEIVGDDEVEEDAVAQRKPNTLWGVEQQQQQQQQQRGGRQPRHDSTLSSATMLMSPSSKTGASDTGTTLVTTSLVALPSSDRIAKFFSIQSTAPAASVPLARTTTTMLSSSSRPLVATKNEEKEDNEEEQLIAKAMALFSSLSSPITRADAHNNFKDLTKAHPDMTNNPKLLARVLDMLETYLMPLSVRRYLLNDLYLWRVAQRKVNSSEDHQQRLWAMLDARWLASKK